MGLGASWGSESQGTTAAAVLPGRVAAKICSLSSPWGWGVGGGSKPSKSQDSFHPEVTDRLCLLYHVIGTAHKELQTSLIYRKRLQELFVFTCSLKSGRETRCSLSQTKGKQTAKCVLSQ